MPNAKLIPVSGTVLKWAIDESGLSYEEFANRFNAKLNVDVQRIGKWITEDEQPTTTQFRRIVQILKRPSAVFFLPEPPPKPERNVQYRQVPGQPERKPNAEEARWLRRAWRLQEIASWALREIEERAIDLPRTITSSNPDEIAGRERERLGISEATQRQWTSAYIALREWRVALEQIGVMVFQLRMGSESCRAFSLWDEFAPVISINSAYNDVARIYSLFHEYGHLLLHEGSICGYPNTLTTPSNDENTERWCESFAAAFLLPRDSLIEYLRLGLEWSPGSTLTFEDVANIAGRYRVSLRAVALRLYELEVATFDLYREVDDRARVSDREKPGGRGKPMHRAERRVSEFGKRLPTVLLNAVQQDVLERHDVLDYMGISVEQIPEIERMVASD